MIAGAAILVGACSGLVGCSSEPPGTNEPLRPPPSKEELEAGQKKVMDGMKAGYKGAPGAPFKKQ
jgi:hypothetical protein